MYFGVRLQPERNKFKDPLDPFVHLKTKFAPLPFNHMPIKSLATCDASHFLNLEKWNIHVKGKTGAEIKLLVKDREPTLRQEVRLCIEWFTEDAIEKLGTGSRS